MIEITLKADTRQFVKILQKQQASIKREFNKELRRDGIKALRPVYQQARAKIRQAAPVDSGEYRRSWKYRTLRVREAKHGGMTIRPTRRRTGAKLNRQRRGKLAGFGLAVLLETGKGRPDMRREPHYKAELDAMQAAAGRAAKKLFQAKLKKLQREWNGYKYRRF